MSVTEKNNKLSVVVIYAKRQYDLAHVPHAHY